MECMVIWRRWNMQDLPVTARREFLDWYIDIPSDKIFIETGWGIGIGVNAEYIGYENALASTQAYEDMSDEERREWQRESLKKQYDEVNVNFKETKARKWYNKLSRKR